MPKPLTYPSLTCVLEYLEANNRYGISTRCPALRKIEKTIPLHIDYLSFEMESITFNKKLYRCKRRSNIELGIAIKNFYSFFFEERCIIKVNHVEVGLCFPRLPVGVNLRIRQLQGHLFCLRGFQEFLDLKRFPLKQLIVNKLKFIETCYLQLPIVTTTKTLIIDAFEHIFLANDSLLKLPNREIVLKHGKLPVDQLTVFVQNLLKDQKEIGTSYTFDVPFWEMINVLKEIGGQLGRTLNKECKHQKELGTSVSYSIFLPISSTSELYVHGESRHFLKTVTRMEVVPITQENRV